MKNMKFAVQLAVLLGLSVLCLDARAVPSFARQTGLPCQQCHTVAPELTAFGRLFKLNGFTLSTLPKVEAPSSDPGNVPVELNRMPPVAAELDVADSISSKSQPGSLNGSAQFPSKFKIFFAGAVSDHIGIFNYFEYTQPDDHFSMDLTDVRITDSGQLWGSDAIYGITVNNAPTLEDPWNTLNVWSFPHVGSEVAPSPGATTLLGGALADSGLVAGAGGYILWDSHWYGDLSLYRAAPTGAGQPLTPAGNLDGTVPYLRLAWQDNFGADYLEAGLSFMSAKYAQGVSGGGAAGLDDHYSDWSLDAQYEHPTGDNQLTLHGKYIHENQTLDSSSAAGLSNASDSLKSLKLDGTYLIRGGHAGYALSLGYFTTTGSADPLLYAPGAVSGFAAGKPDSDGWILQGTYLPYANVQFTVQYTAYSKFNGASSNYDGSGRNASDNNTLFLLMMIDW
ncbi:MAG: hypothetical protein ACM3ZT_11910 [Bacillota bacterium]